jgi:sulfur-oxidizing protein SoxY
VEADLPMTPQKYVKSIYIISDKNRRPLNAKFSLTPEVGKAAISTNIRLAGTTDLRAIVEMNDGALYMAKQEVKVTIGGCGG